MGLTPLEGLVMGTRSGDVDPGLHDFIAGDDRVVLGNTSQCARRSLSRISH